MSLLDALRTLLYVTRPELVALSFFVAGYVCGTALSLVLSRCGARLHARRERQDETKPPACMFCGKACERGNVWVRGPKGARHVECWLASEEHREMLR